MSPEGPIHERAVAQRMALWLAMTGVFAAAAGSFNVVKILGSQTPLLAAWWLGLMLALTAAAVQGARSRTAAVIWAAAGGVFGFVAIASGSVGVFFAPAGLLLVAAAVATSIAERARLRTLLIPVWLVAGASGVAALTLLIAFAQSSVTETPGFSQQIKLVPSAAVIWGSVAFAVMLVLVAARALMRIFESRIR